MMSALDRTIARLIRETDRQLFGTTGLDRLMEKWSDAARVASIKARQLKARMKGQHSVTGLGKGIKGAYKRGELARHARDLRLESRLKRARVKPGDVRQEWQSDRDRRAAYARHEDRKTPGANVGGGHLPYSQGRALRSHRRWDEQVRRGQSEYYRDAALRGPDLNKAAFVATKPYETPVKRTHRMSSVEARWTRMRNTAAARAYAKGNFALADKIRRKTFPGRRSA
jgi:hypothetical protein